MLYVLGRSRSPFWAIIRLALPVMFISAFMNNTPIVALMVPILIAWARRSGVPVKKVLIPLAFASTLGGTCTLIGTSTNLVISGQQVNTTRAQLQAGCDGLRGGTHEQSLRSGAAMARRRHDACPLPRERAAAAPEPCCMGTVHDVCKVQTMGLRDLPVLPSQEARYAKQNKSNQAKFGIFDIAPYGVPYALWGVLFIALTQVRGAPVGASGCYYTVFAWSTHTAPVGCLTPVKTWDVSGMEHAGAPCPMQAPCTPLCRPCCL
jgi:hypothetical protein